MAPWVTVGQPVALQVDAYPGKTITGKLSRISPAVNPATRDHVFAGVPADEVEAAVAGLLFAGARAMSENLVLDVLRKRAVNSVARAADRSQLS